MVLAVRRGGRVAGAVVALTTPLLAGARSVRFVRAELVIATIGLLSVMPPAEPWKAVTKANTPPSEAASQ